MKKNLILLLCLISIYCGKNSEVTWNTELYSDPDLTTKIMDVKKGTVVTASEYRNHKWNQKKSIKVMIDGKEGFISPKYIVIGQDPEKSVYKWAYNPKYKKFYEATDKKHYKDGYVYPSLDSLPKDKIPLDDLLK